MEKTCRTCEFWMVTGSGEGGHAMFPGSWGTERRERAAVCQCERLKAAFGSWPEDISWTKADEKCREWLEARDIIDECSICGALLFEYNRPDTPREYGGTEEFERNGKTRFWWGPNDCEHEGERYHGLDPFTCGMCQGNGTLIINRGARMVQCDACHGKGTVD